MGFWGISKLESKFPESLHSSLGALDVGAGTGVPQPCTHRASLSLTNQTKTPALAQPPLRAALNSAARSVPRKCALEKEPLTLLKRFVAVSADGKALPSFLSSYCNTFSGAAIHPQEINPHLPQGLSSAEAMRPQHEGLSCIPCPAFLHH